MEERVCRLVSVQKGGGQKIVDGDGWDSSEEKWMEDKDPVGRTAEV